MRTHVGNAWTRGVALAAVTLFPALAATQAEAQATIGLYELARFNLNLTSTSGAQFIGSNPIAVGWNGSKLYVAGQNATGVTTGIGLIEITNAANVTNWTAGGFVTPTFSSTFGSLSTINGLGYRGLSMQGNKLLAAWDNNANSPNSIQMFDATTNTKLWDLTATGTNLANVGTTRGYAGPDFDPGYLGNSGSGSGAAWATQGVGRRLVNDPNTGAPIYVSATNASFMTTWPNAQLGFIFNTNPTSSTWRDIAFDPATGDLYARNQNGVTAIQRTGSNSGKDPVTSTNGQSALIWTQPTPGNNIGTNIGFMSDIQSGGMNSFSNPYAGDLLVFNDRSSTAGGQSWTNIIKFTTTSGSAVTPNWTFLSTPSTGVALYDFEWDQSTQTLAVLDYSNRTVSLFSTAVPEPSTWAMLITGAGACGGMALRRRMRRRG